MCSRGDSVPAPSPAEQPSLQICKLLCSPPPACPPTGARSSAWLWRLWLASPLSLPRSSCFRQARNTFPFSRLGVRQVAPCQWTKGARICSAGTLRGHRSWLHLEESTFSSTGKRNGHCAGGCGCGDPQKPLGGVGLPEESERRNQAGFFSLGRLGESAAASSSELSNNRCRFLQRLGGKKGLWVKS